MILGTDEGSKRWHILPGAEYLSSSVFLRLWGGSSGNWYPLKGQQNTASEGSPQIYSQTDQLAVADM